MLNILCGKSGCGKDTLLNELKKEGFIPLISTTSRPIRDGETNGVEYNFTTREEFERRIAAGEFIEYRTYDTLVNNVPDTWYYGMPKQTFDPEKEYIVILDFGGAEEFLKAYGHDICRVCYIDTDDNIREQRASQRGSFDKTEWDRRLADDKIKFAPEVVEKLADFTLTNNNSTINELKAAFLDKIEELKKEQDDVLE